MANYSVTTWVLTEIGNLKHLDVYIGRDEFGYEEIRGSGAEEYKRLVRERPDPSTDWM